MSANRKRVEFQVWDSEVAFISKSIPDFLIARDQGGNIKLQHLLDSLRKHYNLHTSEDSHLISYYNQDYDCYVMAGKYGSLTLDTLPEYSVGECIRLKFRVTLNQIVNTEA